MNSNLIQKSPTQNSFLKFFLIVGAFLIALIIGIYFFTLKLDKITKLVLEQEAKVLKNEKIHTQMLADLSKTYQSHRDTALTMASSSKAPLISKALTDLVYTCSLKNLYETDFSINFSNRKSLIVETAKKREAFCAQQLINSTAIESGEEKAEIFSKELTRLGYFLQAKK